MPCRPVSVVVPRPPRQPASPPVASAPAPAPAQLLPSPPPHRRPHQRSNYVRTPPRRRRCGRRWGHTHTLPPTIPAAVSVVIRLQNAPQPLARALLRLLRCRLAPRTPVAGADRSRSFGKGMTDHADWLRSLRPPPPDLWSTASLPVPSVQLFKTQLRARVEGSEGSRWRRSSFGWSPLRWFWPRTKVLRVPA
eukprot:scaffold1748_cov123-Isochrysis_galbana.AAC.7